MRVVEAESWSSEVEQLCESYHECTAAGSSKEREGERQGARELKRGGVYEALTTEGRAACAIVEAGGK